MGDDVASQLNFGSLSVSGPRYNLYKTKGENLQKKRRDEYLQNLRNKRRDLTQYARALALDTPVPDQPEEQPLREEELSMMEVEQPSNPPPSDQTTPSPKPQKPKKNGREKYLDQLMLPEPLVDVPGDLKEKWFAVPVPAGTRCLVISARNTTTSRLGNGTVLNKFASALPSGYPSARGKVNDYCILDCIFHESSSTYFVLDIMCWKTYSLYNCATDFRFYWKSTKLDETTAAETGPNNPYKFIPLPYFPCDAAGLRSALLPNPEGQFEKQSVVFYNMETDYTLGLSPLMCSLELTTEEGRKMSQQLLSGDFDAMQWSSRSSSLSFSLSLLSLPPLSLLPAQLIQ
jgi:snurportin-1